MPIPRLTGQSESSGLPLAGRLFKGAPKTRPDRPGKDLDYFRFQPEQPGVGDIFRAAFGPEPDRLAFYLAHERPEEAFPHWMEEWGANGLRHRCTGTWVIQERINTRGDYAFYETGEKECPYASGDKERTKDNPGCTPVGRMEMLIPELVREGHCGAVLFRTGSQHDIVSIWKTLQWVYEERGSLLRVRFTLWRQDEEITTPPWEEGGKRQKTVKSLVKVTPEAEWVRQRVASSVLAAPEDVEAPALPEPETPEKAVEPTPAPTPQAPEVEAAPEPSSEPESPSATQTQYEKALQRRIRVGKYEDLTIPEAWKKNSPYVAAFLAVKRRVWKGKGGGWKVPEWVHLTAKRYAEEQFAERRPFGPTEFKQAYEAFRQAQPPHFKNAKASPEMRGFLVGVFNQQLFPGGDGEGTEKAQRADRYRVFEFLFGEQSSKNPDLTWGDLAALRDLIGRDVDGKFKVYDYAPEEASHIATLMFEREMDEAEEVPL